MNFIKTDQQEIALNMKAVTVVYDVNPVLWNVSCKIPQGVLLAVVGPNGAGKTTFIKTALGLTSSISGSVYIFEKQASKNLSRVAYIPQRSLIDWDYPATVFDVVMMGRFAKKRWFSSVNTEDTIAVLNALHQVGMQDFAQKPIGQLSGGQQQRCFLARALVQDADLYILDEPFVGIDLTTEKAIVALLKQLQIEGKTIIVVHHDLQTLREYFDWVLLLNVSVVACGPIKDVLVPEFVCKAYGQNNMYGYTIKK